MNDAAWERLVDAIDVTVGIDSHNRSQRPLEDRPDLTQQVEQIEFERGGQAFRLERTTGPAILDRKTHYSHRAGTANRVEYIYDEHELANKVTLYRETNGEWVAAELDQLSL